MAAPHSKSFVFGFCFGGLLVLGINFADYLDWHNNGRFCFDCAIPFGFPFDMYASSGFASPAGFNLKGLTANFACGGIFSLGMGWIFQQAVPVIASFRKS